MEFKFITNNLLLKFSAINSTHYINNILVENINFYKKHKFLCKKVIKFLLYLLSAKYFFFFELPDIFIM